MSDHNRSEGSVSLADATAWMQSWSEKISMDTLVITGGEPTLNPDLFEIIKTARSCWPDTHIKLVTNGEQF
jgi:MoaA/NifB/PqqE/SkfB family radical SAM enzyme